MPRNEPQRLRQTIQAVKELILEQGLQPGDPLPTEAQLVELLDVSRGNLREAVRTLVALDILEVRHGTGTFVGQMSLRPLVEGLSFRGVVLPGEDFQSLRQIVEVRTSLDHTLAPAVVEHMDDEVAEKLGELCDAMATHSRRGESFTAEDRAFHMTLAGMLPNELYTLLVGAFWDVHTQLAPRLGVPTPRDISDTVDAHRAMLTAAINRDLDAYRDAVRAHYAPLLRVLGSSPAAAAG